jgi:hypothetical protein
MLLSATCPKLQDVMEHNSAVNTCRGRLFYPLSALAIRLLLNVQMNDRVLRSRPKRYLLNGNGFLLAE